MAYDILDNKRKALKINLNESIYGSFAEIGAGQEVARNFFTAGGASGTIAKTMSAYDMAFSNAIYGVEENGRYVTRSRLLKMLDHEYLLLLERLTDDKYKNKTFFSFSNTVTTLNYSKNNDPHGWLGIRFQLYAGGMHNTLLFHVRLLDTDAGLQQNVLGILGVNLIYAAFFYPNNYQQMIESLADNLSTGSVEIDLIHVEGPDFRDVDNKLLNLYLITKGYASASIFGPEGQIYQAKDFLYKQDLLILRTRFNQKKQVAPGIIEGAVREFLENEAAGHSNLIALTEIAMEQPAAHQEEAPDFTLLLEKLNALVSEGHTVIVSNFYRHHNLAKYLARHKPGKVRIIISVKSIANIFNAANYQKNYTRELLAYISNLFSEEVRLYVYPEENQVSHEMVSLSTLAICDESRSLFNFLLDNEYLKPIVPVAVVQTEA